MGSGPVHTAAGLLEVQLAVEHDWNPSTWQNYWQAGRTVPTDRHGRAGAPRVNGSRYLRRTAVRSARLRAVRFVTASRVATTALPDNTFA